MGIGGEKECPADQVAIDLRVVGGHVRDQFVDELLMLFVSLKDRHTLSVLRGYQAPSPIPVAYLKGRNRRSDAERESFMHWYRRRKERRAAVRAARLLLALDALAGTRPGRPQRVGRASVGAAR
jgi:hypothetical protein